MKTLNLTLVISFLLQNSLAVYAQVPSMGNETSNNGVLYDNAKKSREQIERQNAGQPVQQIRSLDTGAIAPTDMNLTDQEKQLSENYLHQGKANEIITKNCAGDMTSVCNGGEGKHKFMGMDPNLVKALTQAYAMIGMIGGDDIGGLTKGEKAMEKARTASAEEAKRTGKEPKEVDDKAKDYCKYIPMVTEGLATAVQTAKSKELAPEEVGGGGTAQKDALLKAAKSHDSRAKMAQVQAAGWWGGAACYTVGLATQQFALDWSLGLKLGAATLLGAFYQNEVSANKEYADKTRAIADSLPGKGDCNPITDNLCYCSQPSTENDPTYCLKGLHAKKIAANSYRIACTNDRLQVDPTCACEKNNSCFDTFLETQGEGSLQLGGLGFASSPFKSIRSLARGELVGGTMNSLSYDHTSAIAKRGLRDLASKLVLKNQPLTKDQQGLVASMVKQGLPANVATLMAQNPQKPSAVNAAMAKFSGASSASLKVASVAPRGSNVVDFSGGNGLGYKGNTGGNKNGTDDFLAKLKPGNAAKTAPNSKILQFAQRAEAQARANGQIRKEDDAQLFEIISLRYQTSGRRLLEIDASN